ncbi:MAG TPA: peroxiredoxin family protein [Dehalococcoidia bacterium]|nr:peroxiredoxin family protein [Dehalococcoidia bacterium]
MIVPQPFDQAPDFTVETTEGTLSLADLLQRGKLILAFYTEDATPMCSTQVAMLKDDYLIVREFGATVLAVSADSVDSHLEFAARLGGIPFPLATDESLDLARAYGVAGEPAKRAHRAIFVIDQTGMVTHSQPWFQPSNTGQYQAIFAAIGLDIA